MPTDRRSNDHPTRRNELTPEEARAVLQAINEAERSEAESVHDDHLLPKPPKSTGGKQRSIPCDRR